MFTVIAASLPAVVGLALAIRTIRQPRAPFAIACDTMLEDVFGHRVAGRVHIALAATFTAFGVMLAVSVLGK